MSTAPNDNPPVTDAPSLADAQSDPPPSVDSTQPPSLNPSTTNAPATAIPSINAPIHHTTAQPAIKSFSPATEQILERLPSTNLSAAYSTQEWEAARNAVLKNMTTSTSLGADARVKEEDM
ncbi:hypothetical protein KCU73_g18117, partial [Aureobasidium melanogenum]